MLRSTFDGVAAGHRHVVAAREADAIASPSLGPLIDVALAVATADIDRIGTRVEALAELCDRRATVCAEHEADLWRWEQRRVAWEQAHGRYRSAVADPDAWVPHPGPPPPRPIAPYPWVEPR